MTDAEIEKALSDPKNYALVIVLGEEKDIVIGAPHHAPLGVTELPCKEHKASDENTGYLAYEITRLLNCNGIIACNTHIDPNKSEDTDYSKTILAWKPKILIEIHGHGGKSAKFDIEVSSGSGAKNMSSIKLADILKSKFSKIPLLKNYTVSGEFSTIYFKARKTFTITTNEWVSFHIELPKSIRQSKEEYSLFCKALAESMNDILGSYNKILELQSQNAS